MSLLLPVVFFLSGLASLTFETLWFHQTGLAFGNSVWASSLVLSGFMAGMGLGNGLAARFGSRLLRPLRAYAWAEAAIAVSGVALVYLLPAMGIALGPWLRPLEASPALLNLTRLMLGFLVLLIPSTAMGTTLPLVTAALTARDARFGVVFGRLYGWNTAGAVAGALAGELVLLGSLGVRGTAVAAGGLLLAIAVTILGFERVFGVTAREAAPGTASPEAASATELAPPTDGRPVRHPARATWLWPAFLSGFCLLALEVVWFRMLLLVVMGEAGAFAMMLAVVLVSMAAGSLIAAAWLARGAAVTRLLAPVALGAAVLCVVGYASFPLTVRLFEGQQVTRLRDVLVMAAPLMAPVAMASGLLFALLGAAVRTATRTDAGAAGQLTASNTAGAALGSLAGGFLLLPVLGSEGALAVLALVYALSGAWLLWNTPVADRRPGYVLAVLALAAAAGFPVGTMETLLRRLPAAQYAALRSGVPVEIDEVREGVSETIVYLHVPTPSGPLFHTMYTNAVAMADTEYFSRRYMKLFVYWPLAVHPEARRALLIAYGVGNSAKAMTDSPGLETIDIVDISRDVLDMNRFVYPDRADSPLSDPRVRVHIEDGRYFLQATSQRYDLITSEPPPPRAAGVVNLYTREYFSLLRDRLNPGGVVAYWLPLHALSDRATRAVLRAFCDAFDDCSLWNGIGSQLMMVGTREAPGPAPLKQFAAQWFQPKVFAEMRRLGLERPEQLGALFIGDGDYLRRITTGVPPLVDDFPKVIESNVTSDSAAAALGRDFLDVTAARERFRTSPLIRRLWPPELLEASLLYFPLQRLINRHGHGEAVPMEEIDEVLAKTPLKTLPLWLLGSNADFQRSITDAEPDALIKPSMQFHLAIRLLAERQYASAVGPLARAQELPGAARQQVFGLRLYTLCMSDQVAEAQRLVDEGTAPLPRYWSWLRERCGLRDPSGPRTH